MNASSGLQSHAHAPRANRHLCHGRYHRGFEPVSPPSEMHAHNYSSYQPRHRHGHRPAERPARKMPRVQRISQIWDGIARNGQYQWQLPAPAKSYVLGTCAGCSIPRAYPLDWLQARVCNLATRVAESVSSEHLCRIARNIPDTSKAR